MASLRKSTKRQTKHERPPESRSTRYFDFERANRVAKELVRDNQEWLKEMAKK